MTLGNLDGVGGTPDSVNVTIEYKEETDDIPEHFLVISEGTYGVARRKVEAIFEMTAGAGSTPAFYTKSDIKIKKRVTIRGVSLFSENDILIESFDTPPGGQPPFYYFKRSYEEPNGFSKDALNIDNSVADELGDWDISPWNTIGRKGVTPYSLPTPSLPYTTTSVPFEGVGFGAEGKICGSSSCQSEHPSVADGVYGYDSTTGTKGNRLTFVDKTPPDEEDQNPDTITYPFDRTVPDPVRLRQLAQQQGNYCSKLQGCGTPQWNTYFPLTEAGEPKVVFIDPDGSGPVFNNPLQIDADGNVNNYGILVVWCGKLELKDTNFHGIIISLWGNMDENGNKHENDLPGGSACRADKGGFINYGRTLRGYAYAEGDTGGSHGIELEENSVLEPLTGPGRDELLGYAFGEDASSSVELTSWRELYE